MQISRSLDRPRSRSTLNVWICAVCECINVFLIANTPKKWKRFYQTVHVHERTPPTADSEARGHEEKSMDTVRLTSMWHACSHTLMRVMVRVRVVCWVASCGVWYVPFFHTAAAHVRITLTPIVAQSARVNLRSMFSAASVVLTTVLRRWCNACFRLMSHAHLYQPATADCG